MTVAGEYKMRVVFADDEQPAREKLSHSYRLFRILMW